MEIVWSLNRVVQPPSLTLVSLGSFRALNHECIEEVYGGINGVLGILKEEIIDLAEESQQNIRGLRYTPASALGTCRFKLSVRITNVSLRFLVYNIRYFFYCGGNDSQDTQIKFQACSEKGLCSSSYWCTQDHRQYQGY